MDFAERLRAHSSLADLRRQHALIDIDIATSTHSVPAHRVVLAAHSGFFRASMRPDWGSKQTIDLRHMTYDTVLTTVDSFYTGCLDISKENALDVLAAASELDVPAIVTAASQVCPRSPRLTRTQS